MPLDGVIGLSALVILFICLFFYTLYLFQGEEIERRNKKLKNRTGKAEDGAANEELKTCEQTTVVENRRSVRHEELDIRKKQVKNKPHDGEANDQEVDTWESFLVMIKKELKLMVNNQLEVINEKLQTLEEKLEIQQKGNTEEAIPVVENKDQYIMRLESKIKKLEKEAEKSVKDGQKWEEERSGFLVKLVTANASSQIYRELLHNFGLDVDGSNYF